VERVHKTRYQEGLATSIGVSPYNMKHALITGCLCFMICDHAGRITRILKPV